MNLFEWELIAQQTFRAKVIGGWIIRYENSTHYTSTMAFNYTTAQMESSNNHVETNSLIFIPDPHHKWDKIYNTQQLLKKQNG